MKRKIFAAVLSAALIGAQGAQAFAVDLSVPFVYKTENGYSAVVKNADGNLDMYMGAYAGSGTEQSTLAEAAVGSRIGSEDGCYYYKTDIADTAGSDRVSAFLWDKNLKPITNAGHYDGTQTYDSDFEFTDDFENPVYIEARQTYRPYGWSYYRWNESGHNNSGYGVSSEVKKDGDYSFYIKNNETAYGGITRIIDAPLGRFSYDFSFDVKIDAGFTDTPAVMLQLFKNNSHVKIISAALSGYDASSEEWQHLTGHICDSALWDYDFDSFTLILGTNNSGSNSAEDTKKMYFDNFKMTVDELSAVEGLSRIKADKFASWYQKGERVTYLFEDDVLLPFSKIKGIVYDIDGSPVFSKEVLSYAALDSGFGFVPEDVGYYEIEFYGIDENGKETLITDGYSGNSGSGQKPYYVSRCSFVVTDGETKPMDERNSAFLISDGCTNAENLALANLVGFSGVRIHSINWGKTASEFSRAFQKAYNKDENDFDWTMADKQIGNAKNAGFKTIIPNIIFTPTWAVSGQSASSWNIVGAYPANLYQPDDPEMTRYAMKNFTERYKDDIYGIEFWNEPYYGESKTAFWYDTAENYKSMTEYAYSGVREADTDKKLKFITAGHLGGVSGTSFLNAMLNDNAYKATMEMLSFHGKYDMSAQFKRVLEYHGLEDIPVMNSEGYYYSYNTSENRLRDFNVNNLMSLMCLMKEFKDGVEFSTHFDICDRALSKQNEVISDLNSGTAYGLFRAYPSLQPYSGAVILHNFFELAGTDFAYENEYDVDGIKAVCFNSDGQKLVMLWNPTGESFSLPQTLKNTVGGSSELKDYEGKSVDKDAVMSGSKLYCIVNAQNLSQLTPSADTALNDSYNAPYYTCTGGSTAGNPSEDYLEATDTYYNDKFTWCANPLEHESHSGAAAKAAYKYSLLGFKGIEFQFYVQDASITMDAASNEDILNYDSVVIAFDSNGNGKAEERDEFHIGMVNGAAVLYKAHAAETGSSITSGSASGTVLSSDYVTISTANNSSERRITYTVKIPFSEIAFASYSSSSIKMSIAVINRDANTVYGAWTFGGGLYNCSPNPAEYGTLYKNAVSAQ